ncbi:MAG: type I-U CRISPR-associated protein Csb2 [Lentisphaeria bacterium]
MTDDALKTLLKTVSPPSFPGSRQREIGEKVFFPLSLLKPDASGWRMFDPVRRTRDVAGMLRHAIANVSRRQGWSEEKINQIVHGKTPDGKTPISGNAESNRLSYLPLPTLQANDHSVHAIRRVLVCAPPSLAREIQELRKWLPGQSLIEEQGEDVALLNLLVTSDSILKCYVTTAKAWTTVTPVILPGHDDMKKASKDGYRDRLLQKETKIESLVRKAFRYAGFPDSLMEKAKLEWNKTGFIKGCEHASRYLPPDNLNNAPRYHVRVIFPDPVPGPIAVGSGRFRGFGLFVHQDQDS